MRTEEQRVAFLNTLRDNIERTVKTEVDTVLKGEFMEEVELVHACIHMAVAIAIHSSQGNPEILITKMRAMIQMLTDCFSGQTGGMIQGVLNIGPATECNSQEEADEFKENLIHMNDPKRVLH